jgi:flagellar hook-basal body complex protein FliE
MSMIPTVVVTPSAAAQAYTRTARGPQGGAPAEAPNSFGTAITQALNQAVETGHAADGQAMKAISGGGNLTDVVTALSHAELTMQTATAIRDRVVQAYQDIMKMPI